MPKHIEWLQSANLNSDTGWVSRFWESVDWYANEALVQHMAKNVARRLSIDRVIRGA